MPPLSINIIAPALPPKLDGIGDHAARLAVALSAHAAVTLLGPRAPADPVPGVRVVPAFDPPGDRRSVWDLVPLVAACRPDWVLLEYNPFAYGRRGLNLSLPRAFAAMRSPSTRLAVYAHEQFVDASTPKQAVMAAWQRWQFRQLGRAADVLFSSVHAWAEGNRRRFPRTPVVHVPVGSNVPRVAISQAEARHRLGIEDGAAVLGVFGTAHNSRLLGTTGHALAAAAVAGHRPVLLYIGPDAAAMRAAFPGHRLVADGALPAEEVSRRLAAVDVYLGGFSDGVSARRGSWLAALQHGLACVGTAGVHTDPVFTAAAVAGDIILTDPADEHGFDRPVLDLLADPARRARLGAAADALSRREFSWDALAGKVLGGLADAAAR